MLATSPNLEDGNDIRYYYQRQEQEGHQITCPSDRKTLERNKVSTITLILNLFKMSLLRRQQERQKSKRHFFVYFFAVIVRL